MTGSRTRRFCSWTCRLAWGGVIAALFAVPAGLRAQTNLLPGATLEAFGTQKDAGGKAAANVHDGIITTRWESADPMSNEFFIFSFPGNQAQSFSQLNLYNDNGKKGVRFFQMFYSSNDAARTDPFDASWQPIPPAGSWVNDRCNLINLRLGAVMEAFGSEKDNKKAASRLGDGSTKTEWESAKDNPDDFFIYSFAGGTSETMDSLVLFNDDKKGVKTFNLFYSSDPAAAADPNHASWTQINGTYNAAKTKNAQSFTFPPVQGRYFMFRIASGYDNKKEKMMELELYGTKTLGQGNVWVAQQSSVEQNFPFSQVSGRYFRFQVAGNYGDKKTKMFEIELLGGPAGGVSIKSWREVIH